ncbi:hypothetical protein DPEC_G00165760 [Dallia pectoralis]|uniref:Uncharacterized protein n=1 Tax=Dallia pectoralis TaxID=75939 RepID=A0ACC2GHU6_DALPE|nr:hypothetical protein DPEC_G00165760 [Dallia pectoralis]
MPVRPAAGQHEPPGSPRQDQHSHTHPYTRTHGSQGGSSDSGSSREEESAIPVPVGVFSFRPARERSPGAAGGMEEPQGNTLVIRIGIPDLAQTVLSLSLGDPALPWLTQRDSANREPELLP